MNVTLDEALDIVSLRQRWLILLRTDESPAIRLTHELLELAVQGIEVEVGVADDDQTVAVALQGPPHNGLAKNGAHRPIASGKQLQVQLPQERASVVVRSMSARLARLGVGDSSSVSDPYGGEVAVPVAMIESNQTLAHHPVPMPRLQDLGVSSVHVRYSNSSREPYHISMSLAKAKE